MRISANELNCRDGTYLFSKRAIDETPENGINPLDLSRRLAVVRRDKILNIPIQHLPMHTVGLDVHKTPLGG